MSHLSTNPTLSTTTDACPDVATELETALSTASVAATFLPPSLLSPTAPARRAHKSGARKGARKSGARPKKDKTGDKTGDKTDTTNTSEKMANVTPIDTDNTSECVAQTRVQDTRVLQNSQHTHETKLKARPPIVDSLEYLMVDQTVKDITKRLDSMYGRRGPCANAEYLQPSAKCAPTKLGAFKGFKMSNDPATNLFNMLHGRGWKLVNVKNHCTYKRTVILVDGTRMNQHFSHSKTTSDSYRGPKKALCDLKGLENSVSSVML